MPTGVYDRANSKRKKAEMWSFACVTCGKVTEITLSHLRVREKHSGTPRFCSHRCHLAYRNQWELAYVPVPPKPPAPRKPKCAETGSVSVPCVQCGKLVYRWPCKATGRVFCSVKCKALSNRLDVPEWDGLPSAERTKAYMAAYVEANRDKHNERCRQWGKANRDKKNENQRRRRSTGQSRFMGTTAWRELQAKYGNACLCCGAKGRLEADHVIPVALGGTNDMDNFQPLCRSCNASKGATFMDYRPAYHAVHGITITEVRA